MQAKNHGFAGVAICLPQVIDNVSRVVADNMNKEDQLDRTCAEVWYSTVDIATNLQSLKTVITHGKSNSRVHIERKNTTVYKDFGGILSIIRNSIETLMNYAVVIGQDTLLLLENMWAYTHIISKEKPDEFASMVVNNCAKSVKDAMD